MWIERVWAMPNKETFMIKPIRKLLISEVDNTGWGWIDPFARNSKWAQITNDLNPDTSATFNKDALEFLQMWDDNSLEGCLYDPPYSLRQLKECYDSVGEDLEHWKTQTYFSSLKKEIARIIKPGGKVICFGWNSGGIGKTNGMKLERILMVPHGGPHHDTIVTVEVKT